MSIYIGMAVSIRKEDEYQMLREQAGESLGVIRHIAINVQMRGASFKVGIKRKLKK
ncbi:hypothetical protein NB622_21205 [Vibrio parahaemolyticus]|uniref:hypothetical protein n=1 Tax=Vibrio parahaemolyticus TaxID=670 RepID=UPI001A8C5CC8|nr:hypothetical protein [Vibrio parahaemolyticus]EJB8540146.1 hypothetical protein [Vibrio parahaemolyticus]MBO0186765.1 hypothetical protein [Vibrio parahaemolyticus]MBO0218258.1 hypothetical protein [Vibrio parahaemolyticus]MBY4624008.1 hypothetical protein [Vibrio parahaemolyticus]MCR9736835.1 hypothetical protein [Vibrio parahaemolyticus]